MQAVVTTPSRIELPRTAATFVATAQTPSSNASKRSGVTRP